MTHLRLVGGTDVLPPHRPADPMNTPLTIAPELAATDLAIAAALRVEAARERCVRAKEFLDSLAGLSGRRRCARYDTAERAYDDTVTVLWDAFDALAATPATTRDGLSAKAHVLKFASALELRHDRADAEAHDRLGLSVADDILRHADGGQHTA